MMVEWLSLKYMKQKLTEIKGEIDKPMMIISHKKNLDEKISKYTGDLNNTEKTPWPNWQDRTEYLRPQKMQSFQKNHQKL